jgi:2'-5' RNA ligase
MRLFTAIELPSDVSRHLGRVGEACAGRVNGVKWTPAGNLHLTLKFIGEVSDERVPEVIAGLERVGMERALELRCDGLVCFPPRGAARIIAARVGGEVDALRGVFEEMEAALEGVCLREGRRYTPHVTLGRSKMGVHGRDRAGLEAAGGALFPGPVFEAGEIVLFCSDLGRGGPSYSVVARL